MYRNCTVAVVVPAYNEETLVVGTLASIPEFVDKIFVVDDGSTDNTSGVASSTRDSRVAVTRHEKNQGVGAAITTGYRKAFEHGIEITAVMAGDNQMDPAFLPRLLDPLVEGNADYSKGNRLTTREHLRGMSLWRLFGNSLLTLLSKFASGFYNMTDSQNGYTAVSKSALASLLDAGIYSYYGYCNDILIKLNAFGYRSLDVVMPARYGTEKSKIRYGRYIARVSSMLLRGYAWRMKTKYLRRRKQKTSLLGLREA